MRMEKQNFSNQQEIFDYFHYLGNTIPSRYERHSDRNSRIEIYCIEQYLVTLAHHDMLAFPVTVEQTDAPDFIIGFGATMVGVEVTSASTTDYQNWLNSITGKDGGYGYHKHSLVDVKPEEECCDSVLERVQKKTAKLAGYQKNYPDIHRFDLLIYENTDYQLEKNVLFNMLMARTPNDSGFNNISVIASNLLLYSVNTIFSQQFIVPSA